jgi:putative membrane protein
MIEMHWDDDWHDNGLGPWWWLFMMFMMVAFWGGLAWLVVTLVRHGDASRPQHAPPSPPRPTERPSPEDVLHDRLARGEIDVEEYHQRIDALRAKRTDGG